jgi:hypothetical protein
MTHFLHGWNRKSLKNQWDHEPEKPLNHLAADSYRSVEPGDVLWIIGIGAQHATLHYRFEIEERVTQAKAERRFREKLWDAKYHFYGTGTRYLDIDITDLLPDLVFQSTTRPRVVFDEEGRFSNQAFRVARRLAPASVPLLEARLAMERTKAE